MCGNRSTAVDVDGVRFVATYQPLRNGPEEEFDEYRTELSSLLKTRKDQKMIVGGDFNSVVGSVANRFPTKKNGGWKSLMKRNLRNIAGCGDIRKF